MIHTKILTIATAAFIGLTITGCAGVETSSYVYDDSYKVNQPNYAQDCFDASVLIDKNLAEAKDIAGKALASIDTTVTEETATTINAQRNRHIGVFVGSGGEELSVTLKAVSDDRTFVAVTTKTGFVGAVGQKAWSCEVINSVVSLASN